MTIVTLTGPTAAGKTSIERALVNRGFGAAISHTTRMPRPGEVNSVHYHFVHPYEFHRMHQAGEFIETAALGENRYAMSAEAMKLATETFKHTVIVVDPAGCEQILNWAGRQNIDALSIWVDCPVDVQAERFLDRVRGSINSNAHAERLAQMLSVEVAWRLSMARGLGGLNGESSFRYDANIPNTQERTPEDWATRIEDIVTHDTVF